MPTSLAGGGGGGGGGRTSHAQSVLVYVVYHLSGFARHPSSEQSVYNRFLVTNTFRYVQVRGTLVERVVQGTKGQVCGNHGSGPRHLAGCPSTELLLCSASSEADVSQRSLPDMVGDSLLPEAQREYMYICMILLLCYDTK